MSVGKLYEIPDSDVSAIIKKGKKMLEFKRFLWEFAGGKLIDRLGDVGKEDSTFMLSALAAVISESEADLPYFLQELIQVCFLDELTRENYYKVGFLYSECLDGLKDFDFG